MTVLKLSRPIQTLAEAFTQNCGRESSYQQTRENGFREGKTPGVFHDTLGFRGGDLLSDRDWANMANSVGGA